MLQSWRYVKKENVHTLPRSRTAPSKLTLYDTEQNTAAALHPYSMHDEPTTYALYKNNTSKRNSLTDLL